MEEGLSSKLSWQRICLQCRRPRLNSWVGKICWRRDRLPTLAFLGFPCGSADKESTCNAGNPGSTPGWEDPLEKRNGGRPSLCLDLLNHLPWKGRVPELPEGVAQKPVCV